MNENEHLFSRLEGWENYKPKKTFQKSFLKWNGGKRAILGELLERTPKSFNRYFEPFLGGGALFFNMPKGHKCLLSDINEPLINCYLQVRDNLESLIFRLEKHKIEHSLEKFKFHSKNFDYGYPVERASSFLYLNRVGFNGIYRLNSKGDFDSGLGHSGLVISPDIIDEVTLRACSEILKNEDTTLDAHPYTEIKPQMNDFVFLDPPYFDTPNRYYNIVWTRKDHLKFSFFVRELDKKGVKFMLCNSDTEFICSLYKDFSVEKISVQRGLNRSYINEVIITNY
jgi:DNA adenine methylase